MLIRDKKEARKFIANLQEGDEFNLESGGNYYDCLVTAKGSDCIWINDRESGINHRFVEADLIRAEIY